jgi:hypothetical protein
MNVEYMKKEINEESMKFNAGLISIIILNYNGMNFLKDCLDSVIKETHYNYEIIVVDNNSPDESGQKYSKVYPSCKFILNEKNVGVPEGLNIGIRNSNGEFIVLLNNDIKVGVGWLDNFFKAYNQNGLALYQPKFLKMKNPEYLDGTGNMINIFGFGFARAKGRKDVGKYEEIEEISYASGTCMFCPKKIFDYVGMFDGKFFAYHEELDFGWRARTVGYKSYYVPKSIVYHYGSAQWKWGGEKFYYLERNRWLVILKNYSLKTIFRLFPFLLVIEIFMLAFFTKKRLLLKKLKSYGSIIRLYKHIKKNRKIIASIRKVNDEHIIKSFCCYVEITPEVGDTNYAKIFNNLIQTLCKLAGFYGKVRME